MIDQLLAEIKAMNVTLSKIERLCNHYPIQSGPILAKMMPGFNMIVESSSIDLGQWLLKNGEWEGLYTKHFLALLKPNDIFLDIGANQGWYGLVAANFMKNNSSDKDLGKVYFIEPNINLCQNINLSLHANGFKSFCRVLNLAISDSDEKLFLAILNNMSGSSTTRRYSGALVNIENQGLQETIETEVNSTSLDALVEKGIIPWPTFIKADIEGWEGAMLKGAKKILQQSKPLIMMEWSTQMDGTPIKRIDVATFLENLGYNAFVITSDQKKLEKKNWHELINTGELMNLYCSTKDLTMATQT